MTAATDKFEKATLVSFYYVIKHGAPYAPVDEDTYKLIAKKPQDYKKGELSEQMAAAMLKEYPAMDYIKWYLGILRGAAALNKKLGYAEGHKDNCWA